MNGSLAGLLIPPSNTEADNRVVDILDIPGKGRCHVYIAR